MPLSWWKFVSNLFHLRLDNAKNIKTLYKITFVILNVKYITFIISQNLYQNSRNYFWYSVTNRYFSIFTGTTWCGYQNSTKFVTNSSLLDWFDTITILGTKSTSMFPTHISSNLIGLPVTIRLLDPPLHEFLPEGDLEQIVGELTVDTGMTDDEIYSRIEKLSEVNPMLGFRGCRCDLCPLKR